MGRAVVVAALLAMWAMTTLTASSPVFHEWLHHGASAANHECVATLLIKGKFFPEVNGAIIVAAVMVSVMLLLLTPPGVLPSRLYRLTPSRGPPQDVGRFRIGG